MLPSAVQLLLQLVARSAAVGCTASRTVRARCNPTETGL